MALISVFFIPIEKLNTFTALVISGCRKYNLHVMLYFLLYMCYDAVCPMYNLISYLGKFSYILFFISAVKT